MAVLSNIRQGAQTVNMVLPDLPSTPGQRSFTAANPAMDITLPPVTVTVNNFPYVKKDFNQLEARITQGNEIRLLKETLTGMAESVLQEVELAVASYWPYFKQFGNATTSLSDATLRQAMISLNQDRVDPQQQKVRFRGTTIQYNGDLMKDDRYVLAINTGVGMEGDGATNPIITGKIPTLYNIGADWNNAMPSNVSLSGGACEVGMLIEEQAIGICFMEFAPVSEISMGSAPVTEWYTRDEESGIRLRWQMYYVPDPGISYIQCDCAFGTTIIDVNRGRTLISSSTAYLS